MSLIGLATGQLQNEPSRRWWGRFERNSSGPGAAAAALELDMQIDIRDVLEVVKAETLVLHRVRTRSRRGARYLAEQLPNARLVELPGEDHWPWIGTWTGSSRRSRSS